MYQKKYTAIPVTQMPAGWGNSPWANLYQIKALRDIPLYSVEEGHLGGYVTDPEALSQEGDCWIGREACVYGNVSISDNAYVGGSARIKNFRLDGSKIEIFGIATIKGHASVNISFPEGSDPEPLITYIGEHAVISGQAQISNTENISGHARISGKAVIHGASEISGSTEISDNALVQAQTRILGNSVVSGNAKVKIGARIEHSILPGDTLIGFGQTILNAIFDENGVMKVGKRIMVDGSVLAEKKALDSSAPALTPEIRDAMNLLEEVNTDVTAYRDDIVKVIKYPVMNDKTDSYTREFMSALKRANRMALNPTQEGFSEAVREAEYKFMAAESNALKIASTALTEAGHRKVQKAKDLLAIASNEASSDHEKKTAFLQGFKQLEGVIIVPEEAVEAFRIKYNLKEIEA
jgi:carbonic anhydrase/acetyltransferase-like protein (isoleucine patch superfamily)